MFGEQVCIAVDELTPQQQFDNIYITSTSISIRLGLSRVTIMRARKTGKLPGSIEVTGNVFLWERNTVEPYLKRWEALIDARARMQVA